jgi:hypothetical protein
MRIDLLEIKGTCIAEIISDKIEISNVQDALDLMASCDYQGARNIIINKKHITPDFFDLKTGIAGEILQKFSTYNVKLAIIGNFSEYTSKSLRDFICESNNTGRISFVNSVNEALQKLLHLS